MVKRNQSVLLESKSPEEKERLFQQWTQDLLTAVQTWSQNLEDGDFKTHGLCSTQPDKLEIHTFLQEEFLNLFSVFISTVGLLVNQVLPSVVEWEWGTTSNFLYQYEGEFTDLFCNC